MYFSKKGNKVGPQDIEIYDVVKVISKAFTVSDDDELELLY